MLNNDEIGDLVSKAKSFEELFKVLMNEGKDGKIKGSKKDYSVDEIIDAVNIFKIEVIKSLYQITRSKNIRKKAFELLVREINEKKLLDQTPQ